MRRRQSADEECAIAVDRRRSGSRAHADERTFLQYVVAGAAPRAAAAVGERNACHTRRSQRRGRTSTEAVRDTGLGRRSGGLATDPRAHRGPVSYRRLSNWIGAGRRDRGARSAALAAHRRCPDRDEAPTTQMGASRSVSGLADRLASGGLQRLDLIASRLDRTGLVLYDCPQVS